MGLQSDVGSDFPLQVLRPGGRAIISQSNRCFPSKAISIWLNTNDHEHCWIIGSYFHFAGGFTNLEVEDISPNPGRTDPMYIVSAVKQPDRPVGGPKSEL